MYGLCTQKYLVYAEHLSFWKSRISLHARQDAYVTVGTESLMSFSVDTSHVLSLVIVGELSMSCVTPLGKQAWSLGLVSFPQFCSLRGAATGGPRATGDWKDSYHQHAVRDEVLRWRGAEKQNENPWSVLSFFFFF